MNFKSVLSKHDTLLGTNISLPKTLLSRWCSFFQRWDMWSFPEGYSIWPKLIHQTLMLSIIFHWEVVQSLSWVFWVWVPRMPINLLGSRITNRWHLKIDGLFGDVFPFSKQGMFRFQPIRPWKFTKEGLVQMIFLFKPVNFSGSKAVNFPGCRFRMSWEAHHQLVGVFIIPRGQQKN